MARGLRQRELNELLEKLVDQPVPDFELDPAKGLPGEHFQARFAAAVPSGEAEPLE